MLFGMGVRTSHIDYMLKFVGFPIMGGNFSVAAVRVTLISLDFCIFGKGRGALFYRDLVSYEEEHHIRW